MSSRAILAGIVVASAMLSPAVATAQQHSSGQTHEGHHQRQADRAMHGARLNDYDRMMDRARDRFERRGRHPEKEQDQVQPPEGRPVSDEVRQGNHAHNVPGDVRDEAVDGEERAFAAVARQAGDSSLPADAGAAPRRAEDSADSGRPDTGPGQAASN